MIPWGGNSGETSTDAAYGRAAARAISRGGAPSSAAARPARIAPTGSDARTASASALDHAPGEAISRAIAGRHKNLLPRAGERPPAPRPYKNPLSGSPSQAGQSRQGADTSLRLTFWKREREDEGSSLAEPHKHPGTLSDFILGSQDGIVNVLGVLLGVAIAVYSSRPADPFTIVFAGALAATFAESISMGAVAYTTTLARRDHYIGERARELREMQELPHIEREEVRQILEGWDFHGAELEDVTDRIVAKPKAWIEMMMAHELNLAPIEESQPARSSILVFFAAIIGSLVPLVPFVIAAGIGSLTVDDRLLSGMAGALIVSALVLFSIGWYKAKLTVGRPVRSGVQMLVIGVASAVAGFGVAYLVDLLI